ncbi:hypothetical protein LAZ67_2003864 [Cordylochernes scorpioides]|uniref:DUF5641 domain-containing protein n=1 Tax=Cordylochernes scorpioides TaxID=51811 RepID=A0ABY6K440_9ARAC|nr:hypothetical protein LAZ67_2003864 [Cordylochernes scorpioides]
MTAVGLQTIPLGLQTIPLSLKTMPRHKILILQDVKLNVLKRFQKLQWKITGRLFVMNRVMEIRSLSETEDWYRVPGCLNPADLPSRGCLADSLERSKWWEGPSWLRRPRRDWPHREIYPDPDIVNSEKRKIVLTSTCIEREKRSVLLSLFNYYKILRVTAWMNRFLTNARGTIGQRVKGDLLAELMLVRVIQRESFTGPEDKRLKDFKLCCDSLGLLRVKTKISRRQDLERLIGLLKQLLRKILGQARLELRNFTPLSIWTLLKGASLQKRYRFRQRLREDLRKRFRMEYFGFLRQETRRRSKTRPIKVGDLVLIGQDNAKRVNWPLARVVEVYPGRDGPVRVAKLRTSKGSRLGRTCRVTRSYKSLRDIQYFRQKQDVSNILRNYKRQDTKHFLTKSDIPGRAQLSPKEAAGLSEDSTLSRSTNRERSCEISQPIREKLTRGVKSKDKNG